MRKILKSLSSSLLYILLFCVLLSPTIAITYYSYTKLHEEFTRQILSNKQILAQQMAVNVKSRLDVTRDLSRGAAADISNLVKQNKWEAAMKELEYIPKEFPYVDRIFLVDKPGFLKAIYPPSPENIGKDFSFRDWYKGVSKNWQPYASEVFKRAPIPQLNTVAVAVPIKDNDGSILGVMGIAMSLDSFYALTKSVSTDKNEFLYIVNQKGQIVAHPKYPAQGNIVDFSEVTVVKKLLENESGVEVAYNSVDKEERLAAYEKVPEYNWGVVVAEPSTTAFIERDKTLNDIMSMYGAILMFMAIAGGIILYALSTLRRSKEVLRKSEEKYTFITKATNDTVWDWNLVNNSIIWNENIYKHFGYERIDVPPTADWWVDNIHPDDKDHIMKDIDAAVAGVAEFWTGEYRFRKKDGRYADISDRGYILRDNNKKAVRFIGSMQDITEQKLYEQKLKEKTTESDDLNKLMIGRELKMEQLEKEIEELKKK